MTATGGQGFPPAKHPAATSEPATTSAGACTPEIQAGRRSCITSGPDRLRSDEGSPGPPRAMTSAHRDLAARAAEGIRPTSPTSTPRRRRSAVRTSEAAASDPDSHHRKGAISPRRHHPGSRRRLRRPFLRWRRGGEGDGKGVGPPDLGSPVAAREGDAGDGGRGTSSSPCKCNHQIKAIRNIGPARPYFPSIMCCVCSAMLC